MLRGLFFQAWGCLTNLKSQTRTPSLKSLPEDLCSVFVGPEKIIYLSEVWTREPWISGRARYPETTEADCPMNKNFSLFSSFTYFHGPGKKLEINRHLFDMYGSPGGYKAHIYINSIQMRSPYINIYSLYINTLFEVKYKT